MTKSDKFKDTKFEELMTDLENIVQKLEDETLSLDDSMELHADALVLVEICRQRLNEADQKIQQLVSDNDGNLEVADLDS